MPKKSWGGRRGKPGPKPAADPTVQISTRVPGWVRRWVRDQAAAADQTESSFTAELLEGVARARGGAPEEEKKARSAGP